MIIKTYLFAIVQQELIIVPLDRQLVVYPVGAGVDQGAGIDEGDVFYTSSIFYTGTLFCRDAGFNVFYTSTSIVDEG